MMSAMESLSNSIVSALRNALAAASSRPFSDQKDKALDPDFLKGFMADKLAKYKKQINTLSQQNLIYFDEIESRDLQQDFLSDTRGILRTIHRYWPHI